MAFRYLPKEKIERAKRLRYESKLRSYKKHIAKQGEKNPYHRIRKHLNLVRMGNRIGSQTNVLRWGTNETREHVLKKLEICIELKEWNHEFITEAIFKNGSRCDVLDLTDGTIYEILSSETDEKCEQKIRSYPTELRIIKIRCE